MLLRQGFPDMPTTTVVLDLISRTGSATRYSLSPHQGMRNIALNGKYEAMTHSAIIGQLMEQQDDFTFYHDDFIYTEYQHKFDEMEMGMLDEEEFYDMFPEPVSREEISAYRITDRGPAGYVRRFEDDIPAGNMQKFMRHVLSNALTNDKAYKAYVKEHPVGVRKVEYEDDDEVEVIENDLQTEDAGSDTITDAMTIAAKRDLAYCLYRMNRMSRRCGVNMLSVVFAQRKSRPYLAKSTRNEKPQTLINNGPVYYADVNGDCGAPITVAVDRAFAKARSIFYVDGGDGAWIEFVDDYRKLDKCLTVLGIDARSDDPRRYTSTFIKHISRKILIDNYSYVARTNGGYNREILNGLRTMSLDLIQSVSVETEVDPLATAVNIILDYDRTPSYVFTAFTRNQPSNNIDLCYKVLPLLQKPEYCKLVSDVISMGNVNSDGFLMDESGNCFKLRCKKFINVSRWGNVSTGNFYIHNSGYVLFEPVNDKLVILAELDDALRVFASEDWNNLPVIALGDNADLVK